MGLPPKPVPREDEVSLWRYLKLFRRDILSAQPARLYRALMAEFRTPFFRSYLINDPALVKMVLKDRPEDFPKSDRVGAGLRPLLGESVFLTNGAVWERQRRIIDPAFEGGRLRESFAPMLAAAAVARDRLASRDGEIVDIEYEASRAAADVIFRTLFSLPIEDSVASEVYGAFRDYQRSQPLLNAGAFLPAWRWLPSMFSRRTRISAARIRRLLTRLVDARAKLIAAGDASDDLATKIMTTKDPITGETFSPSEMVDQVAIFFLAGHETSASALGWALYLLATHPEWQARVAQEAVAAPGFSDMSKLKVTRDVFREALRLYPPVPMMVRETTRGEVFRARAVRAGAQVVLSPWHLHRHERFWEEPDAFDPDRWDRERDAAREAFIPFSAGRRVCSGAGFAMMEGVLMLSVLVGSLEFEPIDGDVPVPVAYLTVRARGGIRLRVSGR